MSQGPTPAPPPAAKPAPLVPPDVDLRGLDFTPLNTHRLMDSDLFALSTGAEFKAACALWCKSWGQVPAASLPNDDKVLAHLAGVMSVRAWRKLRAMALRGWVLCDDGRLYHPLIAENALAAWSGRVRYQEREHNRNGRQVRWRDRCAALHGLLRDRGVTVNKGAGIRSLLQLAQQHIPGFDPRAWTGDASETPAKRPADVSGPSTESPPPAPPAPAPAPAPASAAPPPGAEPTAAGRVCRMMKSKGLASVNPGDPRLLRLLADGATDEEFEGLAVEAVEKGKGWAWLLAVLPARRKEAADMPALAPQANGGAPDPMAWTHDRQAVVVRGINLGIGPWDAVAAAQREGESWDDYRDRVIEAELHARGEAA